MGKIYNAPEGLNCPSYTDYQDFDKYQKACEVYEKAIKAWAKTNGTCPEAGKEIHFPVGDGAARYVVVSLKPIQLIHINTGDSWHFQYADRLTAADIRKEVKKVEGITKIFQTSRKAK